MQPSGYSWSGFVVLRIVNACGYEGPSVPHWYRKWAGLIAVGVADPPIPTTAAGWFKMWLTMMIRLAVVSTIILTIVVLLLVLDTYRLILLGVN